MAGRSSLLNDASGVNLTTDREGLIDVALKRATECVELACSSSNELVLTPHESKVALSAKICPSSNKDWLITGIPFNRAILYLTLLTKSSKRHQMIVLPVAMRKHIGSGSTKIFMSMILLCLC